MEYGLTFFFSVLAGLALGVVIFALIFVFRRRPRAEAGAPETADPPTGLEVGFANAVQPLPRQSRTVVLGKIDDKRDEQLNHGIQEVRETLVRLADIISKAASASDKATTAFSSTKDAIGENLDGGEADMAQIKAILIAEVDHLLKSNSYLKSELEDSRESIAVQRRQIEILRERTRVDSLTDIPNRAAFDERLREFIASFERNSRIFSLLMIDVDFFKRINDDYGHVNGDRILRGVAAKIAMSARVNDFVARYGGEEFMVIFPEINLDEGRLGAERIRSGVANANFKLDTRNIKITISGGLVESVKGMTSDEIVAAADKALYFSKQNGRNRISCAVKSAAAGWTVCAQVQNQGG
ncbi:MAG: GGDEF domain-containing protein [Planctomycetota bacterium]|jgi:diguanylate cyclase|nr:GGDEF domain-containing protein [Planctomycetota bacterium]